ncbi:MAG: dihydrofolate reductase, partial [Desulfobacteraceae bacterium]|nr:dihydrofolate reductase [Desulfobacteraceae bacterium]
AIIGGSVVNSLFAKENLITQIHVTLVPAVFGQGLSLFNTDLDLSLEYVASREIAAGHLLLMYKVIYE